MLDNRSNSKRKSVIRRVVCLVADGFGVGEAPDAAKYGDQGSNTLGHILSTVGTLNLPNLGKLGLGNIGNFDGLVSCSDSTGLFGKMLERSAGKDTTTGHWEIAGLVTKEAFATFPNGFPNDLVSDFVVKAKIPGVLGNYAASGTLIIEELGEQHQKTGKPILYTSADSVFQLAAHEESFGLQRLYGICEVARKLTQPRRIGRVIARPFMGRKRGNFKRTENRRDFSIAPKLNLLDCLESAGIGVFSVGKIEDIFNHRGITRSNHTGNNLDSLKATVDFMEKNRGEQAFIFTNLVDFDMLYGHRRDPFGYAKSLEELDNFLPKILGELTPQDVFVLTADHGCDPTFKGTDHTREYVPLLVYRPRAHGGNLGVRQSFADIAATVLEGYELKNSQFVEGTSFLCNL